MSRRQGARALFRSAPFSLRKRAGRRQGANGPACSLNPPFLRIDLQRLCLLASVQHGGMRCLRQDGQTCQAQRSHPQFPIGQDRLKRMRRGYGADEKIKDVVAHSAGIQDGAGPGLCRSGCSCALSEALFVDGSYTGSLQGAARALHPPQLPPLWRCPLQACGHCRPQAAASEAGCRPVKDIRNRSEFEGAK